MFAFSGWSTGFAVEPLSYNCCCGDSYNYCTPCFVGVRTIFSAAIWISLSCCFVYRATLVSIAPYLAASVAVAIVFAVAATASVAVPIVAVVAAVVCRRSL